MHVVDALVNNDFAHPQRQSRIAARLHRHKIVRMDGRGVEVGSYAYHLAPLVTRLGNEVGVGDARVKRVQMPDEVQLRLKPVVHAADGEDLSKGEIDAQWVVVHLAIDVRGQTTHQGHKLAPASVGTSAVAGS